MRKRAFAWILPLAAAGFATSVIPWDDLTEGDWLYALATRFALVDGHKVHYPTPTAELAKLLEGRTDPGALRHLAEARLNLGDRAGALATMQRWAAAQGPAGWAETARWAMAHGEPAAAFKAAEQAMPGLTGEDKRSLADERIKWADRHPSLADGIALRKARAEAFADDPVALEAWLRALETAGRLAEADQGLAAAKALSPERRLLVRSDLKADHGDRAGAFRVLDEAIDQPWSRTYLKAYARRCDQGAPSAPGTWRAALERGFDRAALVRLHSYFVGRDLPTQASDLLRQVERRHGAGLDRAGFLLMGRLYAGTDDIPEAFRAVLAGAHLGAGKDQDTDLAELTRLALRAGGRPLAWGSYNDEAYRWAAAVDRTPGLWTGGVSFLLTGVDWKEAVANLESQSLPDRSFATARVLAAALEKRAPGHPALPGLKLAIMTRHVQRGEARPALALLPELEKAPEDLADQARAQALLAAQQVDLPRAEEVRLMRARLRHAAPDGTNPSLEDQGGYENEDYDGDAWTRLNRAQPRTGYRSLLEGCVARLDRLDGSHATSVDLLLRELDRMPDAEPLWLYLAGRLEGWNLDDQLGPRYQQALQRFQDPGIWDRAARWYARHNYHADLRKLADDVTTRFRGSELFRRGDAQVYVQVPDQPPVGMSVRMVVWADWVRLKALERFPHSPRVFHEASRLVTPAQWQAHYKVQEELRKPATRVIVPEQLLEERRWAVLYADPAEREAFFAREMRQGHLEARLAELEGKAGLNPVEDRLLFEGWARLSRFEKALEPGERLCRAYPGDGDLARQVLSLHRSLNGLQASHAAAARTLVERTAPALEDPAPLWTELGEMEEDRGHGEAAMAIWKNLLARSPRDPEKLSDLATLLWDYNHDKEALAVVEDGRRALGRPRWFAFETGVLRENLRDLDGAVREYLEAIHPDTGDDAFAWFESDQRALRRLAQLLARPRVYAVVERRIQGLAAGDAEAEKQLAAYFPLGSIEPPHPGLEYDADAWIDAMDQPNDPVGRAQREAAKLARRPREADAVSRIGELLLARLKAMVPRATSPAFLDFAERGAAGLGREHWNGGDLVLFKAAVMARRSHLAAAEEDKLRLDMERAEYLAAQGRGGDADAVWGDLAPRLERMPEGSARLRAESRRAAYLERSKGTAAAAEEWRRVTARHPWSLGLLEDRLAFLDRAKLGEEARALLEATVPRAAAGHKENLLEQLAQAALAADDVRRARWAAEQMLAQPGLEDARRLTAVQVAARLTFRQTPGWDPMPLAKAQAALVQPEAQADVYQRMADAADQERVAGAGVALWIEALNRRTERAWLVSAARATRASGRDRELLAFFERQRERSPRDVRWAVAVRDLKRFSHDVEGAVAAAKAAVTVRPEQEILWREAADILVRADRPHEAADYLEAWQKPRPASEDVARWRGELYARAGDGARALAVEQQTLRALAREGSVDAQERAQRKARAAVRLLDLGHPDLAARLYGERGAASLAEDREFPAQEAARAGLLLGQFTQVVEILDRRNQAGAAAAELVRRGRPEQREDVEAWLLRTLWPAQAPRPSDEAVNHWWRFAVDAGLETSLRAALAQRLLAARPGPWQNEPPFPLVRQVGDGLVRSQGIRFYVKEPDLAWLWVRDLARRDRPEELLAFVEPRWQELVAAVRGSAPVTGRQSWTVWLDDRESLEAWARAAANHPEKRRELGDLMGDRRAWDRFWGLAARGWSSGSLVGLLPEGSRIAWFRFWEKQGSDPVLLARQVSMERADQALARLLQNEPGAAADPLLERLRGPRTVGEVLGKDARWVWPEFMPRRDARGELAEQGDDRIAGQGVDLGRLPGRIWGERPGEAWYVLEALARHRTKDPSAPWLPLEAPGRGQETPRVLLAMRLARAQGDPQLALRIAESRPGPAKDRTWLEGRLLALAAAGRKPEAEQAFVAYLQGMQDQLTEASFQDLAVLASRLGLPSPLDGLDPQAPVGPVFLAYLQDLKPDLAARLHTADRVSYRTALADRWFAKRGRLTRAQAEQWMRELWVNGAAQPLPQVLAKLGPAWPASAVWLNAQPQPDRAAALATLAQALDPAQPWPSRLNELTTAEAGDPLKLMAVQVRLARNELDPALAIVDAMLARAGGLRALDAAAAPAETVSEDGEEGGELTSAPAEDLAQRLETWLVPFRAAGKAAPVVERFRRLLADQRRRGTAVASEWRLAFRLAPAAEAPALVQELDEAWFRGEVEPSQLGPILDAAGPALGEDLPRWLARWKDDGDYDATRLRVGLLARLRRPEAALRALLDTRAAHAWSAKEEALAFDLWRTLPPVPALKAPAYWTGAAAVWRGATPLGERLRQHPHDLLAARAALRNLNPGDASALARAGLVLTLDRTWARDAEGDLAVLRLRAARGLLPGSALAARTALEGAEPEALLHLLTARGFKAADVDAALADLARIQGRSGRAAEAGRALKLLSERGYKGLAGLQAELAPAAGKASVFRLEGDRPAPIRPRDLTWALLSDLLTKEGV